MFNVVDLEETLKLENQFCFVLYALSRRVTSLYRPLLKPLGITYPQYLVMLVLWESHGEKTGRFSGSSIKYLCEKLHLDTGTLTPLLKRMEQQQLITRTRSVRDEREVVVALTEQGINLKEQAKSIPMTMLCQSKMPVDQVGPIQQQLVALLAAVDK